LDLHRRRAAASTHVNDYSYSELERTSDQTHKAFAELFCAVNPMMALPALIDGEGPILFESLAIIEYLDETHPNPPLLPRDARVPRACAGARTNRRLRFAPADRAARARLFGTRV